jgi:hypothetical protein
MLAAFVPRARIAREMNMNKHSMAIRAIAAAALAASAGGSQAAARSSVSYVADFSSYSAYLVDWNTSTGSAHVTTTSGEGDGSFTDDGTQRLVTLSTPITWSGQYLDICGNTVNQTTALKQFVFRPVSGTARRGSAQVVDIGTVTNDSGCEAGTTPFGSPSDPGTATTLLDMSLRPSTSELVPGAKLAGMSEVSLTVPAFPPAQVVTFGSGNVSFDDTHDTAATSAVDGWIVLSFPDGHQTAYTRLARNATTGVESWFSAPWSAGSPQRVDHLMMVQPNAAAGFGTRNQAAHSWLEGLFLATDPQPWFDLYRDYTGAMINRTVADGAIVSSMPAKWKFVGANIQIKRSNDFSTSWRQRTWVPLANYGKNHFVMESEDFYDAVGGFQFSSILPRVNFYVDHGQSVEPTARTAAPALQERSRAHGAAQ